MRPISSSGRRPLDGHPKTVIIMMMLMIYSSYLRREEVKYTILREYLVTISLVTILSKSIKR